MAVPVVITRNTAVYFQPVLRIVFRSSGEGGHLSALMTNNKNVVKADKSHLPGLVLGACRPYLFKTKAPQPSTKAGAL